ncbi:MAG: SDR family NAD(P)-dependent oxidoreductase [Methylovulum sp.]|nr:SDR family NAD(P)-dependent oxidoreductase [Methylovulum sp.]
MTQRQLGTILITGATGGIGNALALHYAKPGVYLLLHGRNADALKALADNCQAQGADVSTLVMDLRDIPALQQWLAEITVTRLPDLVIANAGININNGINRRGETWQDIEALLDLNVKSTFALVNGLIPAMRKRGSGQLALISSLAAFYGLPITPSYCASKAAIKAYGEALRGWLARDGIHVNVVMPGYIKSGMCDAMPGPKPFLMMPDKAARIIATGLARNQARISFPFPLNLGTWLLAVLPAALSLKIVRLLNYGG